MCARSDDSREGNDGADVVWTPALSPALQWKHEGQLSQAVIAVRLGTTERNIEGWVRRFEQAYIGIFNFDG